MPYFRLIDLNMIVFDCVDEHPNFTWHLLQLNQAKRTPQDYINKWIIWILNLLFQNWTH